MRICVIGSSQMAAMKMAHDDGGTPADVGMRFMGRGGGRFRTIIADRRGISIDRRPDEKAGPNAMWVPLDAVVRYDEHDVFVVYGLLRLDGLLQARIEEQSANPRFTRSYIEKGVEGVFTGDPTLRIAGDIARWGGKPTYVLAAPLFAEKPTWTDGLPPEPLAEVDRLVAQRCADVGAIFVPQPAATIVENSHTAPEFARGLGDMGTLSRMEHDVVHMNPDYGRIVLDAVLQRIAADAAADPSAFTAPPAEQSGAPSAARGLSRFFRRSKSA
ncbi:hypothetical protein [Acuticoccus mangrovi]|uniref:Uncharacterized protein n=1 Tax=Acuticoccus mangrovi TaxID=2796142 RepID=A0A934ILQ1_9HYPH|nr:hypothetical protein [Acuticoccus mangrovi]MBJ3777256.1 hypothetical protein [Acuticoccus mangrovi]